MFAVILLGLLTSVGGAAFFGRRIHQWLVGPEDFVPAAAVLEGEDVSRPQIDLSEFQVITVEQQQPPISDVVVKPADAVGDAVNSDEIVIGVVINGQSRAYSVNTLTGPGRSVLNDTVGNRAIAATW